MGFELLQGLHAVAHYLLRSLDECSTCPSGSRKGAGILTIWEEREALFHARMYLWGVVRPLIGCIARHGGLPYELNRGTSSGLLAFVGRKGGHVS